MPKPKRPSSPFAYEGLDRILHERARLSILTSLLSYRDGLSFGELKELCALTDGNLNRHLAVLEDAKLVAVSKASGGARTTTRCRMTAQGRRRYFEYLVVLDKVIADAAAALDLKVGIFRSSKLLKRPSA